MSRSAVDRLACVDVPALPLQLLLQREPSWRDRPVVVVARDQPQARLLWVNEHARALRVLPGMRYAAALSLTGELRAGVVDAADIKRGVAHLTRLLREFSPEVEPAADEPGVFWLDATGLARLFRSATAWAEAVDRELGARGFEASVVVGYTRFGTYAAARTNKGPLVFADPGAEQVRARNVPLERLDVDPAMRDALARLGVHTVGAFLELPATGVFERFGPEAHRLRRLAGGELTPPLQPAAAEEPIREHAELDYPEADLERLLFVVKRLLDPALAKLAARRHALAEIVLSFVLDVGGTRIESIRPARPTLAVAHLLDLVRLRLEGIKLTAHVEEIGVEARGTPATMQQLSLFEESGRRDLTAAERALARLRAELGDHAVVRARLADGHLPEAGFLWEPLAKLTPADARAAAERVLVRRVFARPLPLPPRPHHLRDDGWLIRGTEHGAVARLVGPYVVSGGWWQRAVQRDYHFACMRSGDVLWVFYDRERRRWYQHGRVE